MMQEGIDLIAQKERKKGAVRGAVVSSTWLLLTAILCLSIRWHYEIDTFLGTLLLIFAVIELGMIVVVGRLLKERLKEIEGGEEDVAAQY